MRSLRFSIAGLMGVVLLCSLGLAALKSPSEPVAAALFFVTSGVLALGTVGVVCGGEAARAWWLGFALFGWGYLVLVAYCEEWGITPPTITLLDVVKSYLYAPAIPRGPFGGFGRFPTFAIGFDRVGNSLWALVLALVGGGLAHAFFGGSTPRLTLPVTDLQQAVRAAVRWWRRPAVVGPACLVLYTIAALVGIRKAPGTWAGLTVLLTWGLIGLLVVAAVGNRGRRRVACVGAVLFGAGYLAVIGGWFPESEAWPQYATERLLNALRPWLPTIAWESPPGSARTAAANARILKVLEEPIPMAFPQEAPLEDVLKYIKGATRGPDGKEIAIYVDPVGLQGAEKTSASPVTIDVAGVRLRETLRIILKQLGMTYRVREGMLLITSEFTDEPDTLDDKDPYLVIGQCALAVFAAGLGGALAPFVVGRRGEAAA